LASSHQIERGKKKSIEKKKYEKKKGNLPLNSRSTLSLWLSLLPSCFCTFVSSVFSRHVLLLKQKKRKKTQKKTIKKKKKCREGKELTFKLPLCPLTFGSCLCPLAFALPFQALSLGILFFSSRRKEKKKP
jgi:hypothetical protein